MISKAVIQTLEKYVPSENICLQEPMAGHTTFRVGGPADCFLQIETEEQLKNIQDYLELEGIPWFVVGNGSNLIVSDDGFRGVVLHIGRKFSRITVEGNTMIAQAGATMAQAAKAALEHGLTGLEFAAGIPGTIGGGVVMNAGAYDGEMSQVVRQVSVYDRTGEKLVIDRAALEFGYRNSVLKNNHFVVTEVVFELQEGNPEAIRATMEDYAQRRREKQPLEYPSAGSTFKRPEGYFAGKLIMDAGLKGFQIGGAKVSEKHCGFVINAGNASAADVMELIHQVTERVQDAFFVRLEPEVIFLGFSSDKR